MFRHKAELDFMESHGSWVTNERLLLGRDCNQHMLTKSDSMQVGKKAKKRIEFSLCVSLSLLLLHTLCVSDYITTILTSYLPRPVLFLFLSLSYIL